MCGISGIFSSGAVERTTIDAMVQAIAHRGPDAHGVFVSASQRVALGHNRLSIIDLSTGANQPFYSHDGRFVIAFNGEVYNFQALREELIREHHKTFRTTSDTEVIVEAFSVWGSAMASRLEGMFALAIFDQQTETLFLFRDRIGKKPLYYFHAGGLFAFASEIKALLRHPMVQRQKSVNRAVINTFLHLGYIPEPHTIYQNIYKFPAGHSGVVDANITLSTQPYWSVGDYVDTPQVRNEGEAKKHLSKLLDHAVQSRMISDVPLGTFLSGGTDSSLVSAIAARHTTTPLKTFSIGFRESKFDESRYAKAVADHLKTDHTAYELSEREAAELMETYLRHFDEPFADTSAIPTMLVSKLARQQVTVVLTGDGGDELFQGYGAYTWANRLNNPLWKLVRTPLAGSLKLIGKSRLERVARLLQHGPDDTDRSHIFSQEQYLFSQSETKTKLLRRPEDFHAFRYDESNFNTNHLNAGERQALFDLQFYLKDDLLVKVDRASMYYALECRCPLLDHSLIEYALSLDYNLKVKNGTAKFLLKELLREHIPTEYIDRPKWGFSVPLSRWMKGELRYLLDDYLNDTIVDEVGLFKIEYVRELKAAFFAGKEYIYNRLWVIIVLHKWWKENC
ncbi:asparagine synthase (glutamine-hydrolyzing) [Chryseolinea lacunae]|uniref:asparagine synthase (glutamine-hydrolyzing) n=1 Tax=Chryseolinea lacunae TaxID=2801331 RepID=A0ABS1KTA7_9BACT|nr:asparagine synthase (glutamine-hydrolyzing) [Chryseolinea lacunae]MBL0742452.1 asparagine synthase (glutamine-hydrolyzing) [Chryseolinea lacunae]